MRAKPKAALHSHRPQGGPQRQGFWRLSLPSPRGTGQA